MFAKCWLFVKSKQVLSFSIISEKSFRQSGTSLLGRAQSTYTLESTKTKNSSGPLIENLNLNIWVARKVVVSRVHYIFDWINIMQFNLVQMVTMEIITFWAGNKIKILGISKEMWALNVLRALFLLVSM